MKKEEEDKMGSLDGNILSQKTKRLLFAIVFLGIYYYATIFGDEDPTTPGAMIGLDNHTLDQIISNIVMLPIMILIFEKMGYFLFPDKD